ncbi:MAG: DEAD/DEAH box helicase [Bacteroidia bacterium]
MKNGFKRYQLHDRVQDALPALGFHNPTPVQEKVIPRFYQKMNMIVEAPTGTGKTAAYGLPLISHLDLNKNKTQALVLAPSRELAIQIAEALLSFFKGDKLKVGIVTGGASMAESEAAIRSGAHIVVAVPGRLRDIMAHNQIDHFWRDIKFFMMDEGDKLLESGFQKDYDQLRKHLRNRIQIGFFSATVPEDAEEMMRERIGGRPEVIRLHPKQVLRSIHFGYIAIQEGRTTAYLSGLIAERDPRQALIFCPRREEVTDVVNFLRSTGHQAEPYYGSLEQRERANILTRFREGHLRFLVASDLAARGLDIDDLPVVINLSIPKQFDYYLHRVGRTGRMGNRGEVFNFIRSEVDSIYLEKHHQYIGLPAHELTVSPINADESRVKLIDRWVKYHFSRGKKDKIRKGDIVGFLVNNAGLQADEIGTITIYDTYSIVDMPAYGYENVKAWGDLKIKGKSLRIRTYGAEEQANRAKAVKNLLRDRKK